LNRDLDWAAMIHQLIESGITQATISELTGISAGTLSGVKSELLPPTKGWNEAIELLDLHLQVLGISPPRVGDHVATI